MNGVGSLLGDERDLRARGTSFVRVAVAGGDTKLLQRVERGPERTLEGVPKKLVMVIEAVEAEVGLIAARAAYRTAAAVVGLVDLFAGADVSDAGLQAQNGCRITSFRGQSQQLPFIEGVPDRSVFGVHQRRFAGDLGRALGRSPPAG